MGFKINYTYNLGDAADMPELGPFFFFMFTLCLLVSLVPYLFRAYALYNLAARRGLPRPWLAWVPVGQEWIMGYLSDQYQATVHRQNKKRRTTLLVLSVVSVGAALLAMIAMVGAMLMSMDGKVDFSLLFAVIPLLSLGMSVVSIAFVIYYYIAMYDVYRSCDPTNATIYLVLSILFGIVQIILLFVCRYKDDGMKPPAPRDYQTPWQPPQPPSSSDPFQIP